MSELRRFWSAAVIGSVVVVSVLVPSRAQGQARFQRADGNADRELNISDPIVTLGFLFLGEPESLACDDAADSDDNGKVELTDSVYTLAFLFLGGPAPVTPFPDCGLDLTEDNLTCSAYSACPGPPSPPVLDPTPRSVATPSVLISGRSLPRSQVQVLGGAAGQAALADGQGGFSIAVDLVPSQLNRLYAVAVAGDGQRSAPATAEVIQDSTPPVLHVDEPLDGAQVTEAEITVAGRVSDMLSGFQGLEVLVGGQSANVAIGIGTNGTFERSRVPLVVGPNTITVSASDALGNTVDPPRSVTVTRLAPPEGSNLLLKESGDLQTAPIHQLLGAPVVVKAVAPGGAPLAGVTVIFRVARSDGGLATTGALDAEMARALEVSTGADGTARAFWRLGSDAGCGNNRLTVTSEGLFGTLSFCATATPGPAAQINLGSGNNQRVEAGAPAPEPLKAWVSDSCNGIPGVPVTFTVTRGTGKVNGQSAVTLPTGPTGHVQVDFLLGPEAGNQAVEATFEGIPGRPNPPAVFTAYGILRDDSTPTSFHGLILDNASQPIGGAGVALRLVSGALVETTSSVEGQFHFEDLSESGPSDLFVQGLDATTVGGRVIPPGSFPALHFEPILVPNASNTLPMPVLLPPLDPRNARTYSTTEDTVLTVEGIEGLEMRIRPGSMHLPDGRAAEQGQLLSLNQVHHDDVPMPMPDGAAPPFAWTLQPAGATFDPPIEVTYPNMSALPPGAIAYFLTFNHNTQKFEIFSSGHVSEDGATIQTDRGSGLELAGWGCNCPPYSVTGGCKDCAKTDLWSLAKAGANLVKDLLLALPKVRKGIECAASIVDAAQTCRETYETVKRDGRTSPEEIASVLSCAQDIKASIGTCASLFPDPADELQTAKSISDAIGAAISFAQAQNCLPRWASIALKIAATINNRVNEILGLTGDLDLKKAAMALACATMQKIIDGIELSSGGQDGGVGGGIDVGSLDRLFDQFAIDLQAAVQGDTQLEASATALSVSMPELDDDFARVLEDLEQPELAGFVLSASGRSGSAEGTGSFLIPNISAPDLFGEGGPGSRPDFLADDFTRVTGTATIAGKTYYAFSDPFQIRQGETYVVPELTITETPPPLATAIRVSAAARLLRPGESTQLTVTGTLGDGSEVDLTQRTSWTIYRTSNPKVATVGTNGEVQAVGLGRAFLTAVNEGSTAVTRLEVVQDRVEVTVEGLVQKEDGTPAPGARITSTAGGETTSGAGGAFALTFQAGVGQSVSVLASLTDGGTSLSASFRTGPLAASGRIDAGVLVLRPYPAIEGFVFLGLNAQGYPEYQHVGTADLIGTDMIFVLLRGADGGEIRFQMGSPDTECRGFDGGESPRHEVRLSPYLIAKHECTQAAWEVVMGSNPSFFRTDPDLPVESVSWDDIQEFETRTGLQLPSEAQWENACRGGTTTPFAFGETLDSVTQANFAGFSDPTCNYHRGNQYLGGTTVVGAYAPNPFGLHDMHGNVWEWCEDVWDFSFYQRPEANGPDPVSTSGSEHRVLRGGAWSSYAWYCRSARRDWGFPSGRDDDLGFRPARPLQ